MAVKDVQFTFEGNEHIKELHAGQSDDDNIPGGFHRGHINIGFYSGTYTEALNEKIQQLAGVDRSECYGQFRGILVSIGEDGDALQVTKNIGNILLDMGVIGQDEIFALYKAVDAEEKKTAAKPRIVRPSVS